MHHIISDGWSSGVVVQDLAALYQASSQGKPAHLPKLEIQYADYALWQRKWLTGEVLESQLAYWKSQLRGAPPALELPTDHPRPSVQTYRGATKKWRLSPELSGGLNDLSQREGVTLFMTLLAGLQTLLHRYTGQEDIVIGAPIAGRTQTATERLIGLFVNTLVLRTNLSFGITVRDLLHRVRAVTLGAYAHQDLPFEKLVEEIAPMRDLSRAPLCQVMLVFQNAPMPSLALDEITIRPIDVETATAKCDLSLFAFETAEGVQGTLEYSTDLFEPGTIDRMLGHFQAVLAGMVAQPRGHRHGPVGRPGAEALQASGGECKGGCLSFVFGERRQEVGGVQEDRVGVVSRRCHVPYSTRVRISDQP
jgi:hypothetical protein